MKNHPPSDFEDQRRIRKLDLAARKPLPLAELARRAAEIAEQGFWVFPSTWNKVPLTPHGYKDATDFPAKAHAMFMAQPRAVLIAVRMGALPMIVGIDVDPSGMERTESEIDWLRAHWANLGEPLMHRTPRGGSHLIYRMPGPPHRIITCRQTCEGRPLLARGIDIKGEGGSMIWAGSPGYIAIHDVRPGKMPMWMIKALTRQPRTTEPMKEPHHLGIRNLEAALAALEYGKTGERNNFLFWAACRAGECVHEGILGKEEAIDMVTASGVKIGLDKTEARRTAKSGVEKTM